MGLADDLIERAEREGGGRWDDPNSNALAVLFGALAREMGVSRSQERDDMAVGMLIQDNIVNGEAKRAADAALLALLDLGIGPDDITALKGKGL